MSSNFLKSFVAKPVREKSGSRSSNRFDYQKNWSLCELLELHAANNEYLMVFEHHDDVVVFDSHSSPSSAIFYQVKTKMPGNWTVGSLTKSKSKDDSSQSILGKLYSNHVEFSDYAKQLVFTSNTGLSAKLRNGDKSIDLGQVSFSQLSDKDKEKIQSLIEPDEQNYCDVEGLSKILIEQNDLRVADHTAITKGKLVEFFEKLHPDCHVHISLVYKTFFDEIRRKTNYEEDIAGIDELLEHKSIGRESFSGMVNTVLQKRNDNDLWAEANHRLSLEGFSFLELKNVRMNWRQYIVDRMNVEDELHIDFREVIQKEVGKAISGSNVGTFKSLRDEVIGQVANSYENDFNKAYIQAAILYEVMKDDSVPASH